eukprot:TRINITY_DN4561_c0_g1_i1.p1 TRINITY_DN4561_c0_g1~~TRINITY_DN4561_c0_g1_i1.p1  ORF type:complete len:421 (-),score=28.98 TRINITY_DN4561_c0_g1_i1:274-1536(-)
MRKAPAPFAATKRTADAPMPTPVVPLPSPEMLSPFLPTSTISPTLSPFELSRPLDSPAAAAFPSPQISAASSARSRSHSPRNKVVSASPVNHNDEIDPLVETAPRQSHALQSPESSLGASPDAAPAAHTGARLRFEAPEPSFDTSVGVFDHAIGMRNTTAAFFETTIMTLSASSGEASMLNESGEPAAPAWETWHGEGGQPTVRVAACGGHSECDSPGYLSPANAVASPDMRTLPSGIPNQSSVCSVLNSLLGPLDGFEEPLAPPPCGRRPRPPVAEEPVFSPPCNPLLSLMSSLSESFRSPVSIPRPTLVEEHSTIDFELSRDTDDGEDDVLCSAPSFPLQIPLCHSPTPSPPAPRCLTVAKKPAPSATTPPVRPSLEEAMKSLQDLQDTWAAQCRRDSVPRPSNRQTPRGSKVTLNLA